MRSLRRQAAFLDAMIPGWRFGLPAHRLPAPGFVIVNPANSLSQFRDIEPDPETVEQLCRLSAARNEAARRAEIAAAEFRESRAASSPVALSLPRPMSPPVSRPEPEPVGLTDLDAKLAAYEAILAREEWIANAIAYSKLDRTTAFQNALLAEIHISTLRRTQSPDRKRDARFLTQRCQNWLIEQRYGGHLISLHSFVIAAMASGVTVAHNREMRPWDIFFALE